MQAAATAVGFSAVLPSKAWPVARSMVVARVPATRRSVCAVAAAAVVEEPAGVDYSAAAAIVEQPAGVDYSAAAAVVEEPAGVDYSAAPAVVEELAGVDYSSRFSVFPMEACDLLGGDACIGIGRIYPEAKLAAAPPEASRRVDGVERDYLSYDGPKTVFPGEACDLLGGEFCEPPYLEGVYKELPHA